MDGIGHLRQHHTDLQQHRATQQQAGKALCHAAMARLGIQTLGQHRNRQIGAKRLTQPANRSGIAADPIKLALLEAPHQLVAMLHKNQAGDDVGAIKPAQPSQHASAGLGFEVPLTSGRLGVKRIQQRLLGTKPGAGQNS